MRIAIDARMMSAEHTRGIGRYIHELVSAMLDLRTGHQFVLLHRDPERSPFFGRADVEHVHANVPWYSLEEQLKMPDLVRKARADLLHMPHWNIPFFSRMPFVVTIHDLLLLHQPWSSKASTRSPIIAVAKRLGYRCVLRYAVSHAHVILVPTEFVKDDIRQTLHVTRDTLYVTGEGLTILPPPDVSRVPSAPYLLFVGSAYPHKRLDLLLDAWKTLAPRHPEFSLVIAGEKDVFLRRYETFVQERHLPRVVFPGRLTDAELAGFLFHADLFVFPTSHEGFGLPPIEALSQGCPIVASDIPPLREILPSDGVSFFRSGDVDDMIQKIEAQLARGADAKWEALAGGKEARRRHDWRAAAKRTILAYERACL